MRLHTHSVADEPRKGLRGRVRSAAAWTALDVAVNRGSGFLIGVIVARLLEPHDFGIYAVALVVHMIVINVSELGVSTALVREEASSADETGPTIVTIAIVTSFVLGALMAASASTLAHLLGAPAATSTIQVMAITLPLAGLSAVPAALLRRDFRMDRLFVADTANGRPVSTGVEPQPGSTAASLRAAFGGRQPAGVRHPERRLHRRREVDGFRLPRALCARIQRIRLAPERIQLGRSQRFGTGVLTVARAW